MTNNNAYFEHLHENNIAACNYFWAQLNCLQEYQDVKRRKDCRFPLSDSCTGAINIEGIHDPYLPVKITLTSHKGISWTAPKTAVNTPEIIVSRTSPLWKDYDGAIRWAQQSPFFAAYDILHALTIHNADDRIDGIHQHTDKFLLWQYSDAFQIIQAGALFETVYQNVSKGRLMNINDFTRRYYYNIGLTLKEIYGI